MAEHQPTIEITFRDLAALKGAGSYPQDIPRQHPQLNAERSLRRWQAS